MYSFLVLIFILVSQIYAGVLNSSLKCPRQCVCQYSHMGDLSIAHWIKLDEYMKRVEIFSADNEVFSDEPSDNFGLQNSFIKITTCMLQSNDDPEVLINKLPIDVQALVILYNGDSGNKTIKTSQLAILNDLTILEIRETYNRNLQLLIDVPLPFIEYANFESIDLKGSEHFKRPVNVVHPSESYDYVPNSDRYQYNVSFETEEDIEILPYDDYVKEIQKTHMPTFYGWTRLQVLRIHSCQLDELQWEIFDGLENLQHLSLEHNNIKIVPPFALYGALHIKTLSLAFNQILDLNYRALAGLLELVFMDLSNNNITNLSERTFPPFPKLERVDLRYNPIQHIFPLTFGVMNYTKELFLGSTISALDLTIYNSFSLMDSLEHLTAENVTADVLVQDVFHGLKNLTHLTLKGRIRKIEFDAFAEAPRLIELTLTNAKLEDISMDAFYGVKELEIIDLSNNKLSYLPLLLFDELKNLKELYLHNNRLGSLTDTFFNLPSLKLAHLYGNPWNCSCKMSFWKQGITNAIRGRPIKNCISENYESNMFDCTKKSNSFTYKFDNKLVPRCDGGPTRALQKSVYYSLRKLLNCPSTVKVQSPTQYAKRIQFDSKSYIAQKYLLTMVNNTKTLVKLSQRKYLYKDKPYARNDIYNMNQIQNPGVYKALLKSKDTVDDPNDPNYNFI